MKNIKTINDVLNREEELFEQALSQGEYESDRSENSKIMWNEALAQYRELNRTKRMTMRVETMDLIKVKARAKRYSMPYQTLLKILFKQFAEGKIEVAI